MSFFVNIGYQQKLDSSIEPHGSVILCSAMPKHELERRKLRDHSHLSRRLFDPQLYLAELEAARSPKHCTKLATYPWFGVTGLNAFDSGGQKMSQWRRDATKDIRKLWLGETVTDPKEIARAAAACVEFQQRLETWAVILPAPLTADPTSDYSQELEWIDAGLAHLDASGPRTVPIYASVAISDLALRHYVDPAKNPLLEIILDQLSARGLDGIYLVIEQRSEREDAKQCSSPRTLRSLLYLVHHFSRVARRQVGVNFIGPFGLVCEAAGAAWWASNWYKSLHRVRLADELAAGRVYPQYWSAPAALDVHLESDFDSLAKTDLRRIADPTPASEGLLNAARHGISADAILGWQYRPSNRTLAIEHYLRSAIQMEAIHGSQPDGAARLDFVEEWLVRADDTSKWAVSVLGSSPKTKLDHVSGWLEALQLYRNDHKL